MLEGVHVYAAPIVVVAFKVGLVKRIPVSGAHVSVCAPVARVRRVDLSTLVFGGSDVAHWLLVLRLIAVGEVPYFADTESQIIPGVVVFVQ
jgi:hypothetical protein